MKQSTLFFFAFLFVKACLFSQPPHELVDIKQVNPRIKVELVYASEDCCFGRAIYPSNTCYVVKDAAQRLSRVQKDLEKHCMGLVILDAYRPHSYEQYFEPNVVLENGEEHLFRHNRGTSVDVTLCYLDGLYLEMPSGFDHDDEMSQWDYPLLSPHVYHNRQVLENTMRRHGFVPCEGEWWHYDLKDWRTYPILDIEFTKSNTETTSKTVF